MSTVEPDLPPAEKPEGAFHHGNLRQAALDAAVREVDAHGHVALSVKALALRLGVTGPALYRHFADRRALLAAVAQVGYARFEAALTAAMDGVEDPWEAAGAVARAYVAFARENRHWFRLQFLSAPDERTAPSLDVTPPRYRERLRVLLGRELGDEAAARDVYLALWAMVHGLAVLVVEGNDERADRGDADDVVALAIRVQIEALRALAGRPVTRRSGTSAEKVDRAATTARK